MCGSVEGHGESGVSVLVVTGRGSRVLEGDDAAEGLGEDKLGGGTGAGCIKGWAGDMAAGTSCTVFVDVIRWVEEGMCDTCALEGANKGSAVLECDSSEVIATDETIVEGVSDIGRAVLE